MSRDIMISVGLDFPKENKDKVIAILNKIIGADYKIINETDEHLNIQFWNIELIEKDFDKLKEYCSYIGKSEYESLDECCFMWEKEE